MIYILSFVNKLEKPRVYNSGYMMSIKYMWKYNSLGRNITTLFVINSIRVTTIQ